LPRRQSPLAARVEHALRVNQVAKLNFPGVFMELEGRHVGEDGVTLEFDDGDWSRDARGELNWPALGVLLDIGLGSVTRIRSPLTQRPATVQLQVQMTGVPMTGHAVCHARILGHSERTAVKHVLSTGTVSCGDRVVAHTSGAFVMLDLPEGVTQAREPWVTDAHEVDREAELDDYERAAVKRCAAAERAASAEHPFIERFWCGVPKGGDGTARLDVPVGAHLGNRTGHVHGGILLGMAVQVAGAAVPGMALSNVSAWFVRPGEGPRLKVRSKVVQQGRTLAVVRTQIASAEGKLVLEAASQHVLVREP
jgi:uncharacterized protein (TIGR00369 family)